MSSSFMSSSRVNSSLSMIACTHIPYLSAMRLQSVRVRPSPQTLRKSSRRGRTTAGSRSRQRGTRATPRCLAERHSMSAHLHGRQLRKCCDAPEHGGAAIGGAARAGSDPLLAWRGRARARLRRPLVVTNVPVRAAAAPMTPVPHTPRHCLAALERALRAQTHSVISTSRTRYLQSSQSQNCGRGSLMHRIRTRLHEAWTWE